MIPEDTISMSKHSLKRPKELSAHRSPKSAVGAVLETVAGGGKNRCPRRRAWCQGVWVQKVKGQSCVQLLLAFQKSGACNPLSLSFPVCKTKIKKKMPCAELFRIEETVVLKYGAEGPHPSMWLAQTPRNVSFLVFLS